jgi:hypothetical protein
MTTEPLHITATRRSAPSPRGIAGRWLAALAAAAAPIVAAAELSCEKSVDYNSARCVDSAIVRIKPVDASAVCADFTKRLGRACRPQWDRFDSCDQFAGRFEELLSRSCLARGVPERDCSEWLDVFRANLVARCERGRTSY